MWFAFALVTAILWGITYTCTERVCKFVDMRSYLCVSCTVSMLIYGLWSLSSGCLRKDLVDGNFAQVWPFVLGGIVCSFAACYSSVAAVRSGGAAFASIIEISYPLWVILFTTLLNGENNISWRTVVGGFIIFLGTLFVIKSHG